MKGIIMSRWSYRLVRWFYALLFLYAGGTKLLAPQSFEVVIEAFGLVPEGWVMTVAVILPALEVAAALGLLLEVRGSLELVTGLLVLFLAIVGYGIWLGLDIDCGCFGPGDPENLAYGGLRPAFYRNLILIAGVSYLYFWRMREAGSRILLRAFIRKELQEEKR